jgi:plasmid stability protein
MATLYVRNVPAPLHAALVRWAEESGRSVNSEVLALLEAEAERRSRHSDWYEELLAIRRDVPLSPENADFAIATIRAHRDGADLDDDA